MRTSAAADLRVRADAAAQAGIAFGAVAWGYAAAGALAATKPAEMFLGMDEIAEKLARA